MRHLGELLTCLEGVLGVLGLSCKLLGRSWRVLRTAQEPPKGVFVRSGRSMGGLLGGSWVVWGGPGHLLGASKAFLGGCWAVWGGPARLLGGSGAFLGGSGVFLGGSWTAPRRFLVGLSPEAPWTAQDSQEQSKTNQDRPEQPRTAQDGLRIFYSSGQPRADQDCPRQAKTADRKLNTFIGQESFGMRADRTTRDRLA